MSSDPSPPRIRTALVGLGRIGYLFHGPALKRDARFELVGVSDPLPERRREAEGAWAAPAFEDFEQMLVAVKPSLVVLASPTPFHAGQAAAAFAAGADVFCEKPVASSLAEVDAMIAAARRTGRRLVPFQPRRYEPDVQVIKALLQSDRLGPVHLIQRARTNYVRRRDWQAFRHHGGGMLNNYGSHCLDELLWLLDGEAIRSVSCQLRCVATVGDADDFVHAVLTTVKGRIIDLHISQAAALGAPEWLIFGSRGAARWDGEEQALETRFFHEADAPPLIAQAGLAAEGRAYQDEELPWRTETHSTRAIGPFDYYDALWRHLVLDEPPPVTLEQARQLLELIERCRRSAETGLST